LAKQNATPPQEAHIETTVVPSPSIDLSNPLSSKLATVAVVALGAALIEVELIPGMLLGVAAMLAPNLLPRVGNALRPMIKGAVRAGYSIAEKAKETASEASEQMQDIVAEVRSEQSEPATAPTRKRPA